MIGLLLGLILGEAPPAAPPAACGDCSLPRNGAFSFFPDAGVRCFLMPVMSSTAASALPGLSKDSAKRAKKKEIFALSAETGEGRKAENIKQARLRQKRGCVKVQGVFDSRVVAGCVH